MVDFSLLPTEQLLTPGGFDCDCGLHHEAPIKFLKIGAGVVKYIPDALKALGAKKPFIVCDLNTKEAAWSFLRTFLDEETQANSWNGIPISKKVYQDKLEDAMTVEYEKDENGEFVLDENGEKKPISIGGFWQEDGTEVQVYAMTQEQADKLWEAVTTCSKVLEQDDAIYTIVFEQAQAFYSGQKTAEEVARLIQSKVTIYVNEQR